MKGTMWKVVASAALICTSLPLQMIPIEAKETKVEGIEAYGASLQGHEANFAVDGKIETYWNSPKQNSMQDYRRFLDLDLKGLYQLSKIQIFNNVDSFYHYEIYASNDGVNYDKVAYKTDNTLASSQGDNYEVDVQARYLRINMSYNSASQDVNIAEVNVFGNLVDKNPIAEKEIQVETFEDSKWGKEWKKVESDEAYAQTKTIQEMSALVERVIGAEYKNRFVFEFREAKDGKDIFEVQDGENGTILIRGNNGISLASGFNHYLRYYAKVDYNPLFASQLNMPKELPKVGNKVLKYTDYDYRYALNFCTYSYTMAFWNWDEYEAFLDWCAMNGINLVLDIVGQEEVLRQTLMQYGYTSDEVKEYVTGPAYYAWFYMQNMFSAGGPLPNAWFEQRVELGRQIHDRMQTYGIQPVMQGFGGQVPIDFREKNPKSIAESSGSWSGYARPHMIKTYLTEEDKANGKEDYFQKVGDSFYQAQKDVFGDITHYYAVDPFHEGGKVPPGFKIEDIYRVVQEKMMESDPEAIWVMQQWQWGINEQKLAGLANKDQALVLDLQSDLRSQKSPMENQQVPWVWNMLHNFGGRMGMDGVPEVLATQIPKAYEENKYMRGIGMTPEAIENSPIVYDLLFDMTWEQDPINYRTWTKDYIERRYGGTDAKIEEAWDILLDTAYKHKKGEYYQGASESIINAKPTDGKINSASTWGHSDIDYDKKEFEKAAQIFIDSYDKYKDSEAFQYDFVDVMKQVLANSAQEYQPLMGQAYRDKNLEQFKRLSTQFLELVKMQDQLLSTSNGFLLGTWIEDARTMLTDMDDWTKDLFEYNARSLITTWGMQKNSSLVDYSNRQWAGLTGDYYYNRWEIWVNNRIKELETNKKVSDPNWYMYGLEWATRKSDTGFAFDTTASNQNVKELAQKAMDQFSVTNMDAFVGDMESEERVNVASNKKVIDIETKKSIEKLTDGDLDSGWIQPNKKKAILELDLEGMHSIKSVGFMLQQIAADFHVKYIVEVFDGEKWVEVGRSDQDVISTKNEIACDMYASKVRYTLESTNNENLPGIYELQVFGVAQQEATYENLALQASATASSSEGNKTANKAIDGNYESLWVNNGAGKAWIQADLKQPEMVNKVKLHFETAGRQFQFKVIGITGSNEEKVLLDKTTNMEGLAQVYTMDTNEVLKAVKVEFTGAVPGSEPWPAIAELEILKEVELQIPKENIASKAIPTSSEAKPAPEDAFALIDGKDTAWVSNNGKVPAWVQLDLPRTESVEEVVLKFEKNQPDRSMAFTVKITNEKGEEKVVFERTKEDLKKPQGEEIRIPLTDQEIARNLKTLRIDISDAKIPSNGGSAWPLISEIELLSSPKNITNTSTVSSNDATLTEEELKQIIDGNEENALILDKKGEKIITMNFDRPYDLRLLQLLHSSKDALKFKVEYKELNEKVNEYKTWIDYTGNETIKNNIIAQSKNAIYSNEVRFIFLNDEVVLNEIRLFETDMSAPLASYIANLEKELSGYDYGYYAGAFTPEAKTIVEQEIQKAKDAMEQGLNSKQVNEWICSLQKSMRVFYETGFVEINKEGIYVQIDDANHLYDILVEMQLNNAANELKAVIEEIQTVIDDPKVTQQNVDTAKQQLIDKTKEIQNTLSTIEAYQVAKRMVEETLQNVVVGEFEGQYYQKDVDVLAQTLKDVEAQYETLKEQEAKVKELTKQLNEARQTLLNSVIHINTKEYLSVLKVVEGLQAFNYDKETWNALQEVYKQAKEIDVKQISQADLDNMTDQLNVKVGGLVLLNREILKQYVDEASQYQKDRYTQETWGVFEDAYQQAKEVLNKESVTQKEIDEVLELLEKAEKQLKIKEEVTPPNQGDQEVTNPETPVDPEGKPGDSSESTTAPDKNETEGVTTGVQTNAGMLMLTSMLAGTGVFVALRKKKENS